MINFRKKWKTGKAVSMIAKFMSILKLNRPGIDIALLSFNVSNRFYASSFSKRVEPSHVTVPRSLYWIMNTTSIEHEKLTVRTMKRSQGKGAKMIKIWFWNVELQTRNLNKLNGKSTTKYNEVQLFTVEYNRYIIPGGSVPTLSCASLRQTSFIFLSALPCLISIPS